VTSTELRTTPKPEVRPLRRDDARGVALLVAAYFAEIGTGTAMTVEQTEQLFATPWLKDGVGFVLDLGSEMAGYGFARPTRWKGTDSIQVGLTLGHGYRDREIYHILTDQLLDAASELARKHGIGKITTHLRNIDTLHLPVVLELGFQQHPVSMLGFHHNLNDIPVRHLPRGFSARPARLPEEKSTVLNLSTLAFDDRDRQGEPLGDTYIDFIAGKSGFDPEQILLAENSGTPVGCAIVNAPARDTGGGYNILELCVLPGSRHLGIGSALVCRVLGWLKARGGRTALTGMFSSNLASTLFWRLGFRPDPQRTFRFFVRDACTPEGEN
jgi:GNAT superfamily N-acetyltransferase